ncbi:winged helix-turn-helix transcriptional regulator [Naumannella sp. ID2617S]|nr:winged helix-turn-helix transcriptional regulator [Naumannella sp. ID2617S]
MADLFHALADETRRLVLDELFTRNDLTLFEICASLATNHGVTSSRQAISQHLGVLEDAGLITTRMNGRTKIHHLDPEPLRAALRRWPIEPEK